MIEGHLDSLPESWETMPFSVLAQLKQHDAAVPGSSTGKLTTNYMEPAIVLRAIVIALAVMNHSRFGFEGSPRYPFLLVGDISFARFQLPVLLEGGSLARRPNLSRKIVSRPAGRWQASRALYDPHFWIPDKFLLGSVWARPEGDLTF
jgi:hypothetical protein